MGKGFYKRTGSFSLQLAEFAKKAGAAADAVVTKTVLDVGERLVELSPVGDDTLWVRPAPNGYIGGRFRANWQYGNFSGAGIPVGVVDAVDPTGDDTVARMIDKVPQVGAAGMVHRLCNNLPYAQRLEDGWSTQAPAGMVHITVIEFQGIVAAAAEAASRGEA